MSTERLTNRTRVTVTHACANGPVRKRAKIRKMRNQEKEMNSLELKEVNTPELEEINTYGMMIFIGGNGYDLRTVLEKMILWISLFVNLLMAIKYFTATTASGARVLCARGQDRCCVTSDPKVGGG